VPFVATFKFTSKYESQPIIYDDLFPMEFI